MLERDDDRVTIESGRDRPPAAALGCHPTGGRYALYRQRTPGRLVASGDVLLGEFASYQQALDARDRDVVAQLRAVGGVRCEVAHVIVGGAAANSPRQHPMLAAVGGMTTGRCELAAELRATARWLRSQRNA